MSSVCSNARSKTWTPVPDHFIDEHLVEMFPLFNQARLQMVNAGHILTVKLLATGTNAPVVLGFVLVVLVFCDFVPAVLIKIMQCSG